MCMMSNVYDHYSPKMEEWTMRSGWPTKSVTETKLDEIITLIKEFRQAVEYAKFLDEKLEQKDCVDPDKAKLEEKIKELEAEIAKWKPARGKGGRFIKETTNA